MSTSGSSNHKKLLCKKSFKSPSSSGKESDLFVDFNIWREDVELKVLNVSRYLILFYSLIILFTGSRLSLAFTFNMFTCVNCRFVYAFVCSCVGGGEREKRFRKQWRGTSLVVQWSRISLPMQGTWV